MSTKLIGIDLGTTNSCVAVLDGATPQVVVNDLGSRTSPSVVAFKPDGTVLVGETAKRQALAQPKLTVLGAKRLIGRRFDSAPVAQLRSVMPFDIVPAPNGDAWVRVGGQDLSPPEVSAHVLRYMKSAAEAHLGVPVKHAIITVPAYFDDAQRQATKDAGEIAGLEVKSILNEPTAAAVGYGVHTAGGRSTVAVFDLGGGTFDVSIVRIEDGVFEVLATNGDTFLGGDDFDRMIIDALIADFRSDTGYDVREANSLQRLKTAAETAKHELSSTTATEINLPFLAMGPAGPAHLAREVDRGWLEVLVRPLLDRLEHPCTRALADAKLEPRDIDQLILVGGMTRMPAVIQRAVSIFHRDPIKGVNPDEIVAIGAATQTGIMTGAVREVVLLDVTPQTLGIRVQGDRVSPIIPRNSTVPLRQTKIFATTQDNQTFVEIEIVQGDHENASANRLLGKFILGDLPPKQAGMIQVSVSFGIDADGILSVNAVETTTGKSTSKKILASSGLSRDQVQKSSAAMNKAGGVKPR